MLKLARGRYFAILAELVADDRARELGRRAFQQAHPVLPDSSSEWELPHFERAIAELERHGASALERAAAWQGKQDPATPEDLVAIEALAEAAVEGDAPGFLAFLRRAGVGSWIRDELARHPGPPAEAEPPAEEADVGAGHPPPGPEDMTDQSLPDLPF